MAKLGQESKVKVQGFWAKAHQFCFFPIIGHLPEKFPEQQTLKSLSVSQYMTDPAFLLVCDFKDINIIWCGIKWGRGRAEIAGRDYSILFG